MQLPQPKERIILKTHELSIFLGVVLSINVGMRVHNNSSLHENHVIIMSINGSYFLDDHVS